LIQALQITSEIGDLLAIKYSKAAPPLYSENDIPLLEVKAFDIIYLEFNYRKYHLTVMKYAFLLVKING
jgi:hypothetical protein